MLTFEDVRPGRYAIQVIHDENVNRELDTSFFGAPEEGYGFSSQGEPPLRPPPFEEAAFPVGGGMTDVSIALRYLE